MQEAMRRHSDGSSPGTRGSGLARTQPGQPGGTRTLRGQAKQEADEHGRAKGRELSEAAKETSAASRVEPPAGATHHRGLGPRPIGNQPVDLRGPFPQLVQELSRHRRCTRPDRNARPGAP